MGLKKKKEQNYRQGTVNVCCAKCDNFVKDFEARGIGGRRLGAQPRCTVMGLENSRRYLVHPDSVCNGFDDTMYAARIMGVTFQC